MKVDEIYLGDCRELIKRLPDNSVDVSFTSPPYNRIRNDTYDHYDDNLTDYYELLKTITSQMLRVTKGYVIVNIMCNAFNKIEFYTWLNDFKKYINGVVIWEKTNAQPSHNIRNGTRSITNAFEYFIFFKDGGEFRSYGEDQFKNVIHSSVNSEHFEGHGAVMKKEVCDLMISKFTMGGAIVLDPFSGMGTTAVSCVELGRHYIGFEISEDYQQKSLERIKKAKYVKEYGVKPIKNQMNIFEYMKGK